MEDTSEVDRLDFIVGQVHALRSIVMALAMTHPNRPLFSQHFELSSQAALAKMETTRTSIHSIEGFQDIAKAMGRGLDDAESPGSG